MKTNTMKKAMIIALVVLMVMMSVLPLATLLFN